MLLIIIYLPVKEQNRLKHIASGFPLSQKGLPEQMATGGFRRFDKEILMGVSASKLLLFFKEIRIRTLALGFVDTLNMKL